MPLSWGASSRDARNTSAKKLLDIGFASKALFRSESTQLDPIPVHGSLGGSVTPLTQQFIRVIEKGQDGRITTEYELPEYLDAPVETGQVIGRAIYSAEGNIIGESDITASGSIMAASFFDVFTQIMLKFLMN